MCPTFRESVGADSVCLQTCVIVYLFSRSLCDFLGFEGHFNDISVTFFLHFEGWVAKWDPGPKNFEKGLKKGPRKPKNTDHFSNKSVFFRSRFCTEFLECSEEAFFLFLVAKGSQMRAPWEHFTRHFAATLER